MHAYLLVGRDIYLIDSQIKKLSKNLKSKELEFKLEGISDTRALKSFLKLKVGSTTLVVIKDIDKATLEALNAFLKSLEEPQENLKFVLTASSIYALPETIVSRCQVIKVGGSGLDAKHDYNTEEFLKKTTPEKLAFVKKIKEKDAALGFLEEVIVGLHKMLVKTKSEHSKIIKCLKVSEKARAGVMLNGNVTLHLTNFVINL